MHRNLKFQRKLSLKRSLESEFVLRGTLLINDSVNIHELQLLRMISKTLNLKIRECDSG